MGHVRGTDGEQLLVAGARRGDPDAWEQLYRRAYPRLIAYAKRRLAAEEQAEEAVSETMVRAMDTIARYRPGTAGVEGWLFGIARNVVLETYRAGTRARPTDPAGLTARGHEGADPVEHVLDAEERELVALAFARLSAQDQEVLELRVLGALDAEEVAAVLGKRAGAVRMAQSRALARLRVELEGLSA